MTTGYWIFEYIKVFLAYGFMMFVWPSVVFRKFLKGRDITFRFGFCVCTQIVIINTAVLVLGLLHILNGTVFNLLFYGSMIGSIFYKFRFTKDHAEKLKRLMTGTYGTKSFRRDMRESVSERRRDLRSRIYKAIKKHIGEYLILAVIVIYGMIYFTHGAFQDYSYGFGDMYPHNAWIYGLREGQIFSAGVYPEGMHCFIYAMTTLFGIRIYSCMLFTAGIHISVFLLSAYILLKEIFKSRYTALLALTLFLTLDVQCIDEIYSMSRLQWTIPQEFGFYTIFLCGAFLLRYLRSQERENHVKWKIFKKGFWDENLYVFMIALAASLVIHFYDTIMAFFLCVAFVPMALHKIIKPKRLVPLMVSVFVGVFVAVLPMAGALASGIEFQGSIGWAMNVINGEDGKSNTSSESDKEKEEQEEGQKEEQKEEQQEGQEEAWDEKTDSNQNSDNSPHTYVRLEDGKIIVEGAFAEVKPVTVSGANLSERLSWFVENSIDQVYRRCYATLYKKDRANMILYMTLVGFVLWFICKVISIIYKLVNKSKKVDICTFDKYFGLVLSTMIFVIMYYSKAVGLPSLVAGSRLCSIAQLLICGMVFIPVDILLWALSLVVWQPIMKLGTTIGVAVVYYIVNVTGNYHGYLYYELTRYNSAVMTTYQITKNLPKQSYTIVSTVDELYQVMEYGFHEELVDFVNEVMEDDYVIPTTYVFLYVEKKPLEYAQSHFFTGPKWLAEEKYPAYYHSYVSQCPDITVSEISEAEGKNRTKVKVHSSVYSHLDSRTMVESRLYDWCKEFDRLYPYELQTFYEDDDFVCYYFKQNPYRLFQLGIH